MRVVVIERATNEVVETIIENETESSANRMAATVRTNLNRADFRVEVQEDS